MAGPNMDQFEAFFRRADLDQDGRISGSEAVSFLQGSNLPKQVLAQIWTHADQSRTGFLGRAEFYNVLKLVTVAQSKRELTPDMVKAALYGSASAKIPAPQINLSAIPAPQVGPPGTQLSATGNAAVPQSTGIRGPQGFTPQQNQFVRPPRPPLPSPGFHSQQGVASQGMPGGGSTAPFHPQSSNVTTDWYGGRANAPPAGVTSQVPTRGISPTTILDGFGLAASGSTPLTQPRPQATTGLTQSAAPTPNDPTSSAYQGGAGVKDSKSAPVSGNGFPSDSIFGDVFSVTSLQAKKDPLPPTSAAGGLPVSSAIVPPSAGPQHTVKPGPLESLQIGLTQKPTGSQHQQTQSTVKQNQHGSLQSPNAYPGGPVNSASGQSQPPWPRMTQSDVQKYGKVFVEVDTDRDGKISGEQARNLFLSWRLPREVLKQVWDLSDQDNDSMLSLREFCVALYLMERYREGRPLPPVLPSGIMPEETVLPSSGQFAAARGNATRLPTPGLQQVQGMTGARSVTHAAGGRPPRPVPIPQPDEPTQPTQPKARVPVLEKHLVDQLSTEEQNSLYTKFQEATEADKKVGELEKEILDAREKIEFYRTKMQELILYKSRCDNRLNEVTERVSADKREVETLAKKYEEKYKQSGDVASKLTIEEATFRDIQEKKMELYRAIVKLEQEGSPDGIQGRADRIQLDLEEQVKALNERCKVYGLHAKPTTLVELPFGWQPGIQEGAADLDENWDKFEDEGFTFVKELTLDVQNVIAPPKEKSSSVRNKASFTDEGSTAVSSPNANGRSDNLPGAGERTHEDEMAKAQSEEDISRSPLDSPARRNAVESPSKKFHDSPFRKNNGGDGSPHDFETQSEHGGAESVFSGDRNFDESGWGKFDTSYDTDAGWDLDSVTTKDINEERHRESSLFGPDDWGLNPIRTEPKRTDNTFQKSTFVFDSVPSTPAYSSVNSPQADKMFQRKSPFGFADSVPSTPAYSSVGSPNADRMFQKKSAFGFADSVPGTPMFSSSNSPKRFSEGSEDHSFDHFSRFDSFSTHDGGPSNFSRFDSFNTQDVGQSNFSRFDSFSTNDGGIFPQSGSLSRFDSTRSTRDSDYDQGLFPPNDSLTRFDSMRSTRDSDYGHELFPSRDSFARFDSFRSTQDADYNHGFPSFDDTDPFGSNDPFKTSTETPTPRRDSDSWKAF